MKIIPRKSGILVNKPIETDIEEKTKGGLYLPQTRLNQSNITKTTVISVGSDIEDIKPGDTILYDKFSGIPISDGTSDLLLINESVVIAILKE